VVRISGYATATLHHSRRASISHRARLALMAFHSASLHVVNGTKTVGQAVSLSTDTFTTERIPRGQP
jgi:hypothetical protein